MSDDFESMSAEFDAIAEALRDMDRASARLSAPEAQGPTPFEQRLAALAEEDAFRQAAAEADLGAQAELYKEEGFRHRADEAALKAESLGQQGRVDEAQAELQEEEQWRHLAAEANLEEQAERTKEERFRHRAAEANLEAQANLTP